MCGLLVSCTDLIIRFGTCKVQCLNQIRSTDLYMGRPAVLFDRACRTERQRIDFSSNVEPLHVKNQMQRSSVSYFCHAHTACYDLLGTQWRDDREDIRSSCFGSTKCTFAMSLRENNKINEFSATS